MRSRIAKRRSPAGPSATIPGEGEPGVIDETEPTSVQQLRRKMRMLHHPRSTEDTYAGWIARFARHVGEENVEPFGEAEIGEFLTELAIFDEVTAGRRIELCLHCRAKPTRFVKSRRRRHLLM